MIFNFDFFRKSYASSFIPWAAALGSGSSWPEHVKVKVGSQDCVRGIVFDAVTSVTQAEQVKGLSGRKQPLTKQEAMVFIFDRPEARLFWMKDTWIPLSIFFFDERGRLLSSQEMKVEPHPANPQKKYIEQRPTLTVLEAPPGYSRQLGDTPAYLCIDLNLV
jgi:uncharacterized membrane protein (UPF0127 family)